MLSKKARSENIVAPILTHLRTQNNNSFTLYSGIDLPADLAKGLNGECDFLLGNMPKAINLKAPIFTIVEAKHENIVKYTPQAAAQMLGARVYNQKRNNPIDNIYGCITTGTEWQFLLLKENTIFVDNQLYPLANLQLLLGILQQIVDFYQKK